MNKINCLVIIEAIIILFLLLGIIFLWSKETKPEINENQLLSSRIYYKLLEPKSYLILNYDPLKEKLSEYLKQNNLTVSVYVENLRDGASMGINQDITYYPASMNKVPIAILIMKQVQENKLYLDTVLPITNEERDAWWGTLYNESVEELPVSVLLAKMLQESDNTAFNVLRKNINLEEDIFVLEKYYGYYDKNTEHNANDTLNVANTLSFYNIYSSLYLSTTLEPKNSEYILELLTNTSFNINKIAGLPENVTVAHKFGVVSDDKEYYLHDCGIIYYRELRIFYCVMTKDMEPKIAAKVIGKIVHEIYVYSSETRTELDTYKETIK